MSLQYAAVSYKALQCCVVVIVRFMKCKCLRTVRLYQCINVRTMLLMLIYDIVCLDLSLKLHTEILQVCTEG